MDISDEEGKIVKKLILKQTLLFIFSPKCCKNLDERMSIYQVFAGNEVYTF